MKKREILFFIFFTFFAKMLHSQIGIYTEDPAATLDINGNTKIRSVPNDSLSDNVLVLGDNNILSKNSISSLIQERIILKSYIKGQSSNPTLSDSIPILDWYRIPISQIDFDDNDDFNNQLSEFTAPEDGFYDIYINLKLNNTQTNNEVGVGILKKDVETSEYSLLAKESFYNNNVLIGSDRINISPPIRTTQTIERLNKGDIIFFGAKLPIGEMNKASISCSIYESKKLK